MKTRNMKTRSEKSLVPVLVSVLLITFPVFAFPSPAVPGSPLSFSGMWESENGKIVVDFRPSRGDTFDAIVVRVSDDAGDAVRGRLGEPLASGFVWNAGTGRFEGGMMTATAQGKPVSLSCVIVPDGADSFVMTARKGAVSKRIAWKRAEKGKIVL